MGIITKRGWSDLPNYEKEEERRKGTVWGKREIKKPLLGEDLGGRRSKGRLGKETDGNRGGGNFSIKNGKDCGGYL